MSEIICDKTKLKLIIQQKMFEGKSSLTNCHDDNKYKENAWNIANQVVNEIEYLRDNNNSIKKLLDNFHIS